MGNFMLRVPSFGASPPAWLSRVRSRATRTPRPRNGCHGAEAKFVASGGGDCRIFDGSGVVAETLKSFVILRVAAGTRE